MTHTITTFLLLQALDVLTSLVCFRHGMVEANPITRMFIGGSPVVGLMAAKAVVVGLAGLAIWGHRVGAVLKANYVYGGVVVWNCVLLWVSGIRP